MTEDSKRAIDKYVERLIKAYDLTREDVDEVLGTVKKVDLEMLLMNQYPIFRNESWALRLCLYQLRLELGEMDDYWAGKYEDCKSIGEEYRRNKMFNDVCREVFSNKDSEEKKKE